MLRRLPKLAPSLIEVRQLRSAPERLASMSAFRLS
jgi:hypothetical protein